MCDPVTIATVALTAGSVAANSYAAGKVTDARNDVLRAERIRQKGLDQQASAINEGTRKSFEGYGTQQGERAGVLGDLFAQPTAAPVSDANATAGSIMPSSSSSVVTREGAARSAAADAFVGQQSDALAGMRSFGDLFGEKSRLQARDAISIDQIGGFKRTSAGVVPTELDAASHAGDGYKLLGDILGGMGSIGTGYALTRGPSTVANSGSMAAARAGDRASVPGYSAPTPMFRF